MSMQSGQSKEISKGDALAVPEVLLLVGQLLSRSALAHCLLVCRPWCLTLKPLLWKKIKVKSVGTSQLPSLSALQENASYIRRLTVEYKVAVNSNWSLTCPYLEDLTIDGLCVFDHNLYRDYNHSLPFYIRGHSGTLRRATIEVKVGEPVLEAVSDCPRLEALTFTYEIQIKSISRWTHMYQKLRLQLHTLVLSGTILLCLETEILTPTKIEEWHPPCEGPSRIQDLALPLLAADENVWKIQLWIVESCSDLVRLRWCSTRFGYPSHPTLMQSLANILKEGRHSKVEDVNLAGSHFNDEDFDDLLKSIQRLTALDLNCTNFRSSSWDKLQAMPSHLETLVDLNLEICLELDGCVVQRMLCSLPNLKSFQADILSEEDLENDPRPWVCHGLEFLMLTFVSIDAWSVGTLGFLSRIQQLRKLDTSTVLLSCNGVVIDYQCRVEWSHC